MHTHSPLGKTKSETSACARRPRLTQAVPTLLENRADVAERRGGIGGRCNMEKKRGARRWKFSGRAREIERKTILRDCFYEVPPTAAAASPSSSLGLFYFARNDAISLS